MPEMPRFPVRVAAFALALLAGSAAHAAEPPQQPGRVPPPPAAAADRFGVYNWGVDDTAYDGIGDRLNWAAAKVAQTGTRTIRVAITARDPYLVNPVQRDDNDPQWLVNVAACPAYAKLFASSAFHTYLLTTYTPADGPANQGAPTWVAGFDPSSSAYGNERTQIENLASYLARTYPTKTFILLNWEGDNAMQGALAATNDASVWDSYVNWQQSRADGVADAKATGVNNVFFGIEFNYVVAPNGEPCGGAPFAGPGNHPSLANRCVIDYVAPRVRNVDYFSYSSWQTINVKVAQPTASLLGQLDAALSGSLKIVRDGQLVLQGSSSAERSSFMLGEFGFARTDYGEANAARFTKELLETFEGPNDIGASYAIFWQVVDNAPPPQNSWGLFRATTGAITTLGTTFTAVVNGRTPTIPDHAPEIEAGGILNADAGPDMGTANIHPESTITIRGSDFGSSGNVVSVIQGNAIFRISAGSEHWSESTDEIKATFPNATGPSLVYVTTSAGLDSQARIVTSTGALTSDFALAPVAASVSIAPGKKGVASITIDRMGGFTGAVTVTPPASTPELKVKPAKPTTTTGSAVTFKLKASKTIAPGAHLLNFTGTDASGRTRRATVKVILQ